MIGTLTMDDYQAFAQTTAVFKTDGLVYCALGVAGEAGEYVDKVKKTLRGDTDKNDPEVKKSLALELGDLLWYVASSALQLGYSLQDIAEMNQQKLLDRRSRGLLQGSGDNR